MTFSKTCILFVMLCFSFICFIFYRIDSIISDSSVEVTTTKFERRFPVIIEKVNHSKKITENSDLGATFEANMNKITSKISKKNETDTTDSTEDFIPDISNPKTCKDLADLDDETIQNKTYIIKNNCDKFEKIKNATKIDTL
ncbi:hypothetical protein COBT_003993, partial [Conglomerata obtusa]